MDDFRDLLRRHYLNDVTTAEVMSHIAEQLSIMETQRKQLADALVAADSATRGSKGMHVAHKEALDLAREIIAAREKTDE